MLEGLFHHKNEEKDYLCALLVSEDRIDAAILETGKDGSGNVLKVASKEYLDGWEHAINAADSCVTEIEDVLPEGKELTKVIFGLFPEWIVEDRIKETHLKKLKQLTTSLSLTPMGFVELPLAIEHLLHHDEGVQQTVVLVGVESKHVTVTLFKIGKSSGSVTFERTVSITTDVEKALSTFTDVEVLPSRVLLYGTSGDLKKLKEDMLNYPWQKKANFIHFPKIEVLENDFAVKAVAIASSTEIIPQAKEEEPVVQDAISSESSEKIEEKSEAAVYIPEEAEQVDEVAEIAQDLGFVKDKDVAIEGGKVETELPTAEITNIVEPIDAVSQTYDGLPLPSAKLDKKSFAFALPKFTLIFKWPKNVKLLAFIGVLVGIILIGSLGAFLFWSLPHAKVTILVTPQNLNQTEKITVDPKAKSTDGQNKILPGKEVSTEATNTKSVSTTGKKNVGDKARGEVTIYNKTLNTKVFKKGTLITAGKLKFTLDVEVQVASASENVGSLSYGTATTALTALDIGTASNIPPSTEFVFADLPTTLYSARNEKAFVGGTSKEVAVVSRDDQKNAREDLKADLEKQAKAQLEQKITSSEKLLAEFLTSKVSKETFNKEVGEEGDQLSLNMTVEVTALSYSQSDFYTLLDAIVKDKFSADYEYKREEAVIDVENITSKDGKYFLTTVVKLKLYPIVAITDMPKKLAGKSVAEATETLRSISNVTGAEFKIDAPIDGMKKNLPLNPKNITIEVSSL